MQTCVHDTFLFSRVADNERQAAGGMVGSGVFAINPKLAHVFGMVGADDNDDVIQYPQFLESGKELGNVTVKIPDSTVIAVNHLSEIVHIFQFARMSWELGNTAVVVHI